MERSKVDCWYIRVHIIKLGHTRTLNKLSCDRGICCACSALSLCCMSSLTTRVCGACLLYVSLMLPVWFSNTLCLQYANRVSRDGLLYDCGCELTAEGDYGRPDYAAHGGRGKVLLLSCVALSRLVSLFYLLLILLATRHLLYSPFLLTVANYVRFVFVC